PGKNLGSSKFVLRVTAVRFHPEPRTFAPRIDIASKGNYVEIPGLVRRLEEAAPIAPHIHAQSCVAGMVGFRQPKQVRFQLIRIRRKRNMHPESVLAHAQPMPLESEEHSVRHTDGAEHAPTAEQANLAGREGFLV